MVVGEAVRTGGLRGAGAGDEDGHRRVERGRRRELRHRHAPPVSARHAPAGQRLPRNDRSRRRFYSRRGAQYGVLGPGLRNFAIYQSFVFYFTVISGLK